MTGNYLFKVKNDEVTNSRLETKVNSAPSLEPIEKPAQNINVLQDFSWTNTASFARLEVPSIILKEYTVYRSSLFQQARYLLGASSSVLGAFTQATQEINTEFGKNASTLAAFAIGAVAANKPTSNTSFIKGVLGGLVAAAGSNLIESGVLKQGAEKLEDFVMHTDTTLKSYLQPYNGLYATKPTGFVYTFPYFEQSWKTHIENWGSIEESTQNKFSDSLKGVSSFFNKGGIGGYTGAASLGAWFPAAYIETPQSYKYNVGAASETKSFSFYLSNTTTFDDVIKNWQLCFLLMYQNMANRTSKILLEPPAIYEVNIPGIYYAPFAYINSIDIKQIGATHQIKIPILVSNQEQLQQRQVDTEQGTQNVSVRPLGSQGFNSDSNASIDTIIPEAYQITISITPLVTETKNLFYHSLTKNKNIYDVSVTEPTISQISTAPINTTTPSPNVGPTEPLGPPNISPTLPGFKYEGTGGIRRGTL